MYTFYICHIYTVETLNKGHFGTSHIERLSYLAGLKVHKSVHILSRERGKEGGREGRRGRGGGREGEGEGGEMGEGGRGRREGAGKGGGREL